MAGSRVHVSIPFEVAADLKKYSRAQLAPSSTSSGVRLVVRATTSTFISSAIS